jgi:hypothetical protein
MRPGLFLASGMIKQFDYLPSGDAAIDPNILIAFVLVRSARSLMTGGS